MVKKIIIRVVVLLLVFSGAVFGIGKFINRDTPDTTQAMGAATLPLVYMMNGDTQMNCLHGYVKEMDVTAMRDALTPIEGDRSVTIQVEPFQTKINGISFEVLTADGSSSLENTKVTKIQEDENYVTATLEFQNKTLINTEYMLKIAVTVGTREVYYYTRIIREDGLHAEAYLDFVKGFYEACMNVNNDFNIGEVMEPDNSVDKNTLAYVNIHSDSGQLTWGQLNPQVYQKPTPNIREINENTATVVMDYMVSATDNDGNVELYHVSEYYRMRYTEARVMLLNFERNTSEVFNPGNPVFTDKGINLGIAGKEITYKNDLKNNYFAFVREGALWCYDVSGNKMAEIFSFPQEKNMGIRDMYSQNDIQIINIDEQGNIYFLVCGYMNRGSHEGESGVAVYYYDAASYTVNECLFVDTKQSYALLKQDVKQLAYVTEDRNGFYTVIDGEVYGINMETRQVENLVSDLTPGCYAGSKTGKRFAWTKENELYNSTGITVMDLDTHAATEITAPAGKKLRILGFIEEDLVYGLADQGDIDVSHEGYELFPMNEILIVNAQGQTVKDYVPSGSYVSDARIEDKLITLTRIREAGGGYEEIDEDHIVSSEADEENAYGLASRETDRKKTETVLKVGKSLSAVDAPQIVHSRQVIYEGSREIVLEPKEKKSNMYYVYAKGSLQGIYSAVNQAVQMADEELGVVVNAKQQIVWERGNKKTKLDLDINTFPGAFMEYSLDVNVIQAKMDKTILDLSGCTLEQVLYFVSEGTPVLAKTPDGAVIIGGYDEYNTRLLKKGDTELTYYGMDDSTALFEEAGNIFVTYLDPLTE